jgi:hypothetical protein
MPATAAPPAKPAETDYDVYAKRQLQYIFADVAVRMNDRLKRRRLELIGRLGDAGKIGLFDIHLKTEDNPVVGYFYGLVYLPVYKHAEEGLVRAGFSISVFLKIENNQMQVELKNDNLLLNDHDRRLFEGKLWDVVRGALEKWNL